MGYIVEYDRYVDDEFVGNVKEPFSERRRAMRRARYLSGMVDVTTFVYVVDAKRTGQIVFAQGCINWRDGARI